MWNKKKSNFLIIKCSFGGMKRFIIPIPLFVLDITLDALEDLAIIGDLFFPIWRKKHFRRIVHSKSPKNYELTVSIKDIVTLCREIINEFRKYGRWQMARIEVEKVSFHINFW